MTPADYDEILPVLVYGTLRAGQRNAGLLAGRADFGPVMSVPGFALHANAGQVWPAHDFGFPFAVAAGSTDAMVAQVVTLHPGSAAQTMRDLDVLEVFAPADPFGGLYVRQRVMLPDAAGLAWTYVAGPRFDAQVRALPRIESGDWASFQAEAAGAPR